MSVGIERPLPVTMFKLEKITSKHGEGVNRIVGKERAVAVWVMAFFI